MHAKTRNGRTLDNEIVADDGLLCDIFTCSKNNPNGPFVEAFSSHFGPRGHQAGPDNQQKYETSKKNKREDKQLKKRIF